MATLEERIKSSTGPGGKYEGQESAVRAFLEGKGPKPKPTAPAWTREPEARQFPAGETAADIEEIIRSGKEAATSPPMGVGQAAKEFAGDIGSGLVEGVKSIGRGVKQTVQHPGPGVRQAARLGGLLNPPEFGMTPETREQMARDEALAPDAGSVGLAGAGLALTALTGGAVGPALAAGGLLPPAIALRRGASLGEAGYEGLKGLATAGLLAAPGAAVRASRVGQTIERAAEHGAKPTVPIPGIPRPPFARGPFGKGGELRGVPTTEEAVGAVARQSAEKIGQGLKQRQKAGGERFSATAAEAREELGGFPAKFAGIRQSIEAKLANRQVAGVGGGDVGGLSDLLDMARAAESRISTGSPSRVREASRLPGRIVTKATMDYDPVKPVELATTAPGRGGLVVTPTSPTAAAIAPAAATIEELETFIREADRRFQYNKKLHGSGDRDIKAVADEARALRDSLSTPLRKAYDAYEAVKREGKEVRKAAGRPVAQDDVGDIGSTLTSKLGRRGTGTQAEGAQGPDIDVLKRAGFGREVDLPAMLRGVGQMEFGVPPFAPLYTFPFRLVEKNLPPTAGRVVLPASERLGTPLTAARRAYDRKKEKPK